MAIAASHPNVLLDTSYSLVTIVEEIGLRRFATYVSQLGAEKLLFGSDHIIGLTPEEYSAKRQIKIIESLPIPENQKELWLYRNAHSLIQLDQR